MDAIREFEVIGSAPDASFGKGAGAQVNVITRSGANRVSATGYEFWRTSAFNAKNYFAPENEPIRRSSGGISTAARLAAQ